jgi:hypothetical protein
VPVFIALLVICVLGIGGYFFFAGDDREAEAADPVTESLSR